MTNDSLFANRILFPDLTAFIEDSRPAEPDIAQTTVSTKLLATS